MTVDYKRFYGIVFWRQGKIHKSENDLDCFFYSNINLKYRSLTNRPVNFLCKTIF